jgi:hypothetical protein
MKLVRLTLVGEYPPAVIVCGLTNMTSSINAHSADNYIDFSDEVDDFTALIEKPWNNFVEKVVPRKLCVLSSANSF